VKQCEFCPMSGEDFREAQAERLLTNYKQLPPDMQESFADGIEGLVFILKMAGLKQKEATA